MNLRRQPHAKYEFILKTSETTLPKNTTIPYISFKIMAQDK